MSFAIKRVYEAALEADGTRVCPQHITPRYTKEEVETAIQPLKERIQSLEAALASLKRQLGPEEG